MSKSPKEIKVDSTNSVIERDSNDKELNNNPGELVTENGIEEQLLPLNLQTKMRIIVGEDGYSYMVSEAKGNPDVRRIGTKSANKRLRSIALNLGKVLTDSEIKNINSALEAHAEDSNAVEKVSFRVAQLENGVAIDSGDESFTQIHITANNVEIIGTGSDVLFCRNAHSLPFDKVAETGDLKRLNKYLNLTDSDIILLIAWVSFTLALPKGSSSKFVFLALMGGQGTGKSSLSTLLIRLIDPSRVGLQLAPKNPKDLLAASQTSHLLVFDNMRSMSQLMSDIYCIASTGGSVTSRQLYTNDEQHLSFLHTAIIFNGIHSFVGESDLTQRMLTLQLKPIDDKKRASDKQLEKDLEEDLPYILRGLFDLIAKIFSHLPDVEVTNPERMIDFSRWLAAYEKCEGVPAGVYQGAYSASLKESQAETLLENTFAASIVDFIERENGYWEGEPAALLNQLQQIVSKRALYSKAFPTNAIALSKRLKTLQIGLESQGITVSFGRGKKRKIFIESKEILEEVF